MDERLYALYTGMVLGESVFLTANEFRTLSYVPELVFINCPLLGHVDKSTRNAGDSVGEFAVGLPQTLLEIGVKAVVTARWAIDDLAAITFADTFYGRMLKGETFGSATRVVREGAYEVHGNRNNTWAAYQCYGNPTYRLLRNEEG